MPMQRERYAENWEQIAEQVKAAADWKCQHCDRPCRHPRQTWPDFVQTLLDAGEEHWYLESCDEVYPGTGERAIVERPQRFTLTVAHLDQDPSNNDPANLRALCSGCHLKHDRPYSAQNRHRKQQRLREQAGQLTLLEWPIAPCPAGHGKDPSRIQLPIAPPNRWQAIPPNGVPPCLLDEPLMEWRYFPQFERWSYTGDMALARRTSHYRDAYWFPCDFDPNRPERAILPQAIPAEPEVQPQVLPDSPTPPTSTFDPIRPGVRVRRVQPIAILKSNPADSYQVVPWGEVPGLVTRVEQETAWVQHRPSVPEYPHPIAALEVCP